MSDSKVILITGSSRGIGAELLRGFAGQGFQVILNYSRAESEAETLQREVSASGGTVLKVQADVSDRTQVRAMFDRAEQEFGPVGILINNASLNLDGPFLTMDDEQWRRVLDVNLTGTFICSQEYALRFKGEDGQIINLGASTGLSGRKNGANYCSAKAGVITLTKCLALELAPRIKVNCVIPGYIDTEEVITRYRLDDRETRERLLQSIPLGRLGTTGDVFRTVNFLVNEATYITGQNFFINGGNYLR